MAHLNKLIVKVTSAVPLGRSDAEELSMEVDDLKLAPKVRRAVEEALKPVQERTGHAMHVEVTYG